MTEEMFRAVLETAGAKDDKDGWSGLPEGRVLTLYAAHDGVPLTIGKVEAIKTSQRIVWGRSVKGEIFMTGLDDLFAAAIDRSNEAATGRKAGFLGVALGSAPGPAWMRAIAWIAARVPWSWLGPIGAAIGLFAGSLLRIRRREVEDRIRAAGIAPAGAVARRMYASLGTGLAELLWLAGRAPGAIDDRFEMAPAAAEALRSAAAIGRGVVVATAHTGNWDLTACAAARWLGDDRAMGSARAVTVVTKRLSWRALDRYWQRIRAERGVILVDAEGAAASVRDALRAGRVVALLVDQAPERASGVAALPFFGRPAKHDLAPAILAARAKAPIVVLLGHRRDDGTHVLDLADTIAPEELRGAGAPLRATARISAAVERFVRARPAQWLWLHRRWK